jgi:hypothetical protein
MRTLNFNSCTVKCHHSLLLIASATLAMAFMFTSCSRDDLPGPFDPINDPDQVDGFADVGAGYDVFDNFADEASVKEHILDYNKLNSDGLVEKKDLENTSFIRTSGTSISTYSSSLSASVGLEGSYMFFSGSVTTNFSKERYSYDSYSFATYHILSNKYQLRLPTDWDASDLKPYLTAQAKVKLNDPAVPPSSVFTIYGTHCLSGVVVGARSDYSVSGRTRDVKEGVSVGIYAEASFSKGYGSGTLNTSVITQQEFDLFSSNMEQHLEVYGGDSELGHNIITKNDYDAWIASIPNKLVFCNYTQNGLIPIWEFCDDDSRKTELRNYYMNSWASDREIAVYPKPRFCILDIMVLEGRVISNPYRYKDRDYYKMDFDLNRGCGGDSRYLWIYYLPGLENDTITPIAEIGLYDTSDHETLAELGAGFQSINVDLNMGAGGDFIYLAFRRRNDYTDKLLTGMKVGNDNLWMYTIGTNAGYNTSFIGLKQHNSNNLQDLNEDAGGSYIYLYYTNQFVDESNLP